MADSEKLNIGKFNNIKLISNKVLAKGCALCDRDLDRPIIGIANSFNDLVPGHKNLRQLSEQIKFGIYREGGTPVEFGVIACCDGITDNHLGAKYTLPSRDIIADSVELQARAHAFDGLVIVASCDKIVPGMIMAAIRLNIPTIFVAGGPMVSSPSFGNKVKSNSTTIAEALGMWQTGQIDEETLQNLTNTCTMSFGSCQFLGTANTMCCLAEALGLCLPGSALIPAVYNERIRSAFESGEAIVRLVKNNITSRDIITKDAIENAVMSLMAIGGSTNAIIHLCAIGHEIGLGSEEMMDMFDRFSELVPVVARVSPSSEVYDAEDLYKAGGIPEVMRVIEKYLNLDAMTVSGKTLSCNLKNYKLRLIPKDGIISSLEEPFLPFGGVAVMRGNIAPDSGVAKPAAIHESVRVFTGTAVCFDGEDSALEAIEQKRIKPGDIVVIRYEGPQGGPGMREMYLTLKMLHGQGLAHSTAVITDGRFSGTNNGCFVGHISPEAAAGGPIALLKDGDKITIDVYNKTINVDLSEAELEARRAEWKPRKVTILPGYMQRYIKHVSSAAEGAVMNRNLD
jgi:dihydroxy-acid dehydratase